MDILNYSNPNIVLENAIKYYGKNVIIRLSTNAKKKYMIYDPIHKKWIHFGQMGYEDFTKHKDSVRRERYLKRTANMRGEWKDNPYSANNLSRRLLW
jgi:hypothetical protein